MKLLQGVQLWPQEDRTISKLFGGSDDSGQDAQIAQNQQVLALQEKLAEQARGDVTEIFPAVRESAYGGYQGALDMLGQAIPQQAGLFQSGNLAAQNTLLAGLPQQNNAILGNPIDLSGLQPTELAYNTDFTQQALPEMAEPVSTVGPAINPIFAQYLAGLGINL